MTCKNCLSYEACDNIMKRYAGLDGLNPNGMACGNFKDKTRFVEVKQGEWLKDFDEDCYCSVCGAYPVAIQGDYCHNCGAKMDGERKDSINIKGGVNNE